ncbi:CPBP family intramembrane glutamic endopeptidase [Ornithinibacillus halophilus]|uniref:CAAX prenyl protease 2/Lysostaphin resistance protein A-like domain-containing protein n=1 Tax=Ornithinibacillus halophilus TaxID=930117 RepID=A0A1M5CS93_9BACI|nr:CPBP family intramembrane glutamic endopeptidase [Ornithinibacillus halophilus]SHF57574.1 hypothetical protein SAMN05216225_1001366 [Ornithinibacillus halophilus]
MKQSEIIQQLSDRELKKSLYFSQLLILIIAIIFSFILFDNISDWFSYLKWDIQDIVLFGVLPGFIIVIIDFILMKIVPEKHYDDGGINKRVFESMNKREILLFAILVAVAEELLFRGVIQTTFGYIFASIVFAIIHVRYLKKPILMISIVITSFLIGYLFLITENLLVTITAHFIIDFILGVYIQKNKGTTKSGVAKIILKRGEG